MELGFCASLLAFFKRDETRREAEQLFAKLPPAQQDALLYHMRELAREKRKQKKRGKQGGESGG